MGASGTIIQALACATFFCIPLFFAAPFSNYVVFLVASIYVTFVVIFLIFSRVNPEERAEVVELEPLRGASWEEIFRNAMDGYAASQRLIEDQVLDAMAHILKSRIGVEGQDVSRALGDIRVLREVFPEDVARVVHTLYLRRTRLKKRIDPERWWKEMEVVIEYAGGAR